MDEVMYEMSHAEVEHVLYAMETLVHLHADEIVDSDRDESVLDEALEILRTVIERKEKQTEADHAVERNEQGPNEATVGEAGQDNVAEEAETDKAG